MVDGSSSESAHVKSGVPQGYSDLYSFRPILMTSLPQYPRRVRLSADDCLLYRPIKCRADQEQLQRDLSALQDWDRIPVQITIYRRLLMGRDAHLDQSEAYDLS